MQNLLVCLFQYLEVFQRNYATTGPLSQHSLLLKISSIIIFWINQKHKKKHLIIIGWPPTKKAKCNKSHLSGPHKSKLMSTVILDAINIFWVGKSPQKQGKLQVIPSTFMHALALQSTMIQVSVSYGEASGKNMRATIKAIMDTKKWQGKIDNQ